MPRHLQGLVAELLCADPFAGEGSRPGGAQPDDAVHEPPQRQGSDQGVADVWSDGLVLHAAFQCRDHDGHPFRLALPARLEVAAARSLLRGVARDGPREGSHEATRLHQDRYGASEEIYLAEVDAVSRADIVIDGSARPPAPRRVGPVRAVH